LNVETKAPVRIDFAGGWSDVPTFANTKGGAVANAAISLFTHVRCGTGGNRVSLRAEDIGETVTAPVGTPLAYDGQLDLHKAALAMLPISDGVEIESRSDVPPGSGLGASGSLDVSLLATLARCREETLDPTEIAEMGFLLETAELKLDGGRQDQYAAALGGFLDLSFGGGAGVQVTQLRVSQEAATDLERHLSIVYTGQSHFSPETHRRVWQSSQPFATLSNPWGRLSNREIGTRLPG
jgi:D-glycero-alpha-D-manno-heptose-7-phosphate kinase